MIYFWENNVKNEAVSITYDGKSVDYVYYASKDNMIWPEELTYTLSNVTVYYSGNNTAILADGSNYAYVQAYAIGRYRDGGDPVVQGTVNLFLIEDSDPNNCFSTQADSGHASIVTANNRRGNEGGVRSAIFIGEYLNAQVSGIEIYQAANTWHYVDTIFDKVWLEDTSASTNGGSVLLNVGSEDGTRYLVAEGRERYRYDSNTTGYTSSPHLPHAYYNGYTDSNGWLWNIYSGSDYANFDNGLSISRNPSTSSTRDVILYLDNPNDYVNKRVTVTIRQSAYDYVFRLYDETSSTVLMDAADTSFSVDVVSKKGSNAQPIGNVNISPNQMSLGCTNKAEWISARSAYRLTFTGTTNGTTSDRSATITVYQTVSNAQFTFNVSQPSSSHYVNGIEVVSSVTDYNGAEWIIGTVLLSDGYKAGVIVKKTGTVSYPVEVKIPQLTWNGDPSGDESNVHFVIGTGQTLRLTTYYNGEVTYNGYHLDGGYVISHVENLVITKIDSNTVLDNPDKITNIEVRYYDENGNVSLNNYIPASGKGYAVVHGTKNGGLVALTPSVPSGQYIWSVVNGSQIKAASRGKITGTTRSVTASTSYDGVSYADQNITQGANTIASYNWVIFQFNIDQWASIDEEEVTINSATATTRLFPAVQIIKTNVYTSGEESDPEMGEGTTVEDYVNNGQTINELITLSTSNSSYLYVSENYTNATALNPFEVYLYPNTGYTDGGARRDIVMTLTYKGGMNGNVTKTFTIHQNYTKVVAPGIGGVWRYNGTNYGDKFYTKSVLGRNLNQNDLLQLSIINLESTTSNPLVMTTGGEDYVEKYFTVTARPLNGNNEEAIPIESYTFSYTLNTGSTYIEINLTRNSEPISEYGVDLQFDLSRNGGVTQTLWIYVDQTDPES